MIKPVLLSLTLTLLSGTVFSKVSDKVFIDTIQDIEKRLLDLNNGLDNLISDVSKLKSKLIDEVEYDANSPIVDIVTVQRTPVAKGYNFSVTYRPLVYDVIVRWKYDQLMLKAESVHSIDVDQNTKMTSVVHHGEKWDSIVVNFFSPKLMRNVDIVLLFSPGEKENITESIGSIPSLVVGTTGDIVYEKGKNVSVKLYYASNIYVDPTISADVVNLSNWNFITGHTKFMEISKRRYADDKVERNVNFMTSTNYVSGLVRFLVEKYLHGDLIHKIEVGQLKVLRPDSETGPFPNFFLHIKGNMYRRNENDHGVGNYQPGEKRRLYCDAIGRNITNITWTRHNSDGTRTIISPDYTLDGIPYTFQSGIDLTTDITDDVTINVTCTAQNVFRTNVVNAFELTPLKPRKTTPEPMDISSNFHRLTGETENFIGSSILDIFTVQSTRVDDVFNFSVTYIPRVDDVYVSWGYYPTFLTAKSVQSIDIDQNTKMTSAVYPVDNDGFWNSIVVKFFSLKLMSNVDIELFFASDERNNITQSIGSMPSLAVGTTGDLVYEKGKNVSVKFRYTLEKEMYPSISTELVHLHTLNFINKINRDQTLWEFVNSQLAGDKQELDVNFMTSNNYVSGLVYIFVQKLFNENLVRRIEVGQLKVLRPDSETGPFPNSFLHIKDNMYERSKNGYGIVYYEPGETRRLDCDALGTNITKITWTRLNSDGTQTILSPDYTLDGIPYTFRSGVIIATDVNDDVIMKFTCTAQNAFRTKVVNGFELTPLKTRKTTPPPMDISENHHRLIDEVEYDANSPIVDIVTVQRTPVAKGYNFRVTYRPLVYDVIVRWKYDLFMLKAESVHSIDIDQNTKMTSVVHHGEKWDSIVVNFFSPKLMRNVDIVLLFSNGEKENITESIGSIPSLMVGTTGDIVYEKGKNVSVQLRYASNIYVDPTISADVINLSTLKFFTKFPKFMDISKRQYVDDKVERNVNFMTSTNYVSGLVHFLVEKYIHGDLIHKVEVGQLKVLRPDSETGPFPNSFLHIKDNMYERSKNGYGIVDYEPGEKRRLDCDALGTNITNITWTRHNSDGTQTILSPDYTLDGIPYTFRSGIIIVTDITDDVTMKFTCTAQNAFRTKVVNGFELTPVKPRKNNPEPMDVSVNFHRPQNVVTEKNGTVGITLTPSLSDVHFIEILIASRERVENGFLFSVSYRPRVHDVEVTWFNGSFEFSGVIEQDSLGVKQTKFLYSIEKVLFPRLEARISSHSKRVLVVIEFNLSDSVNVHLTEWDDILPFLEVQTESGNEGDFIYEIGHNVTLKVTSDVRAVKGYIFSDIVDVATGKFYSGELNPIAFGLNLVEVVKSTRRVLNGFFMVKDDFKLSTSKNTLSGLLTFTHKQDMSGGLINGLKVYITRALRPFNQTGVFPDRFMTIKKVAKSESAFNAVTHVNCRLEDVCLVTCTVLGTDIENVTLVQVDEDGTKTRVNQTSTITSYSSEVSTTFWVSPTDRQNRTFNCTAKNAHSDVISEKIVAVPVTLVILPQLSYVRVLKQNGKYKPRYKITCTAKSSRRPDFSIRIGGNVTSRSEDLSKKIRQLSRDIYQITKIQIYDIEDNSTYLSAAYCMASTPYERVERRLYVPAVN